MRQAKLARSAGAKIPVGGREVTTQPAPGELWLHEIKHDGFRVIARKHGERVKLYSRPGNDLTRGDHVADTSGVPHDKSSYRGAGQLSRYRWQDIDQDSRLAAWQDVRASKRAA